MRPPAHGHDTTPPPGNQRDPVTRLDLQVAGEYDPLAPLEDVIDVYESLRVPKELWVVENDFHNPRGAENFGSVDIWCYLADWLRDALDGRIEEGHDRRVLVRQRDGLGPYAQPVDSFLLPDNLRLQGSPGLTPSQRGPAGVTGEDAC